MPPPAAVQVHGSCHCGAVRWRARLPRDAIAWDCNCSICANKANLHVVIPEAHFTLLQGADSLTTYRFNTKRAQHKFCRVCGVQSFYVPRSNPDGVGVNPRCFDAASRAAVRIEVKHFDGNNWEAHLAKSGIAELSKL